MKMDDLRAKERDAYLARLRDRAAVRDKNRQLQKKAEQERAQAAAHTAVKFLYTLDERSQVRVNIREKRVQDTAAHEEIMAKLGQAYRSKMRLWRDVAKAKDLPTDSATDSATDLATDLADSATTDSATIGDDING